MEKGTSVLQNEWVQVKRRLPVFFYRAKLAERKEAGRENETISKIKTQKCKKLTYVFWKTSPQGLISFDLF